MSWASAQDFFMFLIKSLHFRDFYKHIYMETENGIL